jgi:hypothetical protein
LKFLNRRRITLLLAILILCVAAAIGAIVAYLNSPSFNEQARQYVAREIERRTGTTVQLKTLTWSVWHQRFRLDELTLRGLEPGEDAPLAHFKRVDVGLNIRTLFEKKIDLFELTLTDPEFHVLVKRDGTTNIPTATAQVPGKPLSFETSIQNFNIIGGSALLNESRININFSARNLASVLNYQASRQVLQTHLRYDGILDRVSEDKRSIPYTIAADMDYTRGTLITHRIVVTSGGSEVKLQGRVNDVLSRNISGRLEYAGNVQVPFLNYFYTKEQFRGKADVAGFLEFSAGRFLTEGNAIADAVECEGWRATKVNGQYSYKYPEKRLSFRRMKTGFAGGAVTGDAVVENLPGPSRVVLNLNYRDMDAAELVRAYPWDPKYRIFSRIAGTLNGWFEGKFVRFELGGHAELTSYAGPPSSEVVALPLDGSTDYRLEPQQARIANADVRLYSTSAKGEGLIHATMSDLKLSMTSLNLLLFIPMPMGAGRLMDGSQDKLGSRCSMANSCFRTTSFANGRSKTLPAVHVWRPPASTSHYEMCA